VHVNGCLDGKPTSFPTKSESTASVKEIGMSRLEKAAIARPAQRNPFDIQGTGRTSAFSKLMAGNAEDTAWATAAASEVASRGKQAYERTCPFYKILPGFSICVDAFRYGAVEGCQAYFLSHFHSDHYVGLTGSWRHGPIYCSKVTGNLVRQQLKVDPKWVVDLEFEKKTEVPGTNGVQVTMIPANHCPGSSLFLFEKAAGKGPSARMQRVLHCGDFRASPAHVQHPLLRPEVVDELTGKPRQQRIDVCYLDTTYLNPKYAFPSQEDVIGACAHMCVRLNEDRGDKNEVLDYNKRGQKGSAMTKFLSGEAETAKSKGEEQQTSRGRLLVVIGTYSIGKERMCLGIARALKCKIYAPPAKQRVCACLEDPELSSLLTDDPLEAQIHMQIMFEIRSETLADYLQSLKPHFSRVVGFRPTGWNYRPPGGRLLDNPPVSTVLHSSNWKTRFSVQDLVPQRGSTRESSCFGVPYSEHSSFRELTMFCCALRIGRVIPTVNVGSRKTREKMKAWFERWEAEKRKSGLLAVKGESW
jgi:DNA cross-link repair 1A protein